MNLPLVFHFSPQGVCVANASSKAKQAALVVIQLWRALSHSDRADLRRVGPFAAAKEQLAFRLHSVHFPAAACDLPCRLLDEQECRSQQRTTRRSKQSE